MTSKNQSLNIVTTLEHIERFSAQLAAKTDLDRLYECCLVETEQLLRLDYSTLFMLDEPADTLVLRAASGFLENMVDRYVLKRNQGFPGYVVHHGLVETVEDFCSEQRFRVTGIMDQLGIRSAIAAPLTVNNKTFGVVIGYTIQVRRFRVEERKIYHLLANQTAIAINNVTMLASLRASEQSLGRKIHELEIEKDRTRKLTDEFDSIFSTITTGVLLLKNDRKVVRCNEKFAEILGYDSARQLRNISTRKIHLDAESYRAFGKQYYRNLIAGKTIQTDYPLRRRDGSTVLCRLSGRSVDQSTPPDLRKGFVWVIEDITRRKNMEKEILQARKLESIGILAAGIGHDYNNILSAILGNLGLAKRLLEPEHNVQELLGAALEAADRARELTEKLLLFTRGESKSPGSTDVVELFRQFHFDKLLRKEVDLHVDLQRGLFGVKIIPDHLKVVFQNLLLNADSCMPEGGKVSIVGHNVEVLEDDIPGLKGGMYVELAVADTGSGIEQDILDNIFDPYFTTKNRDSTKGIGLGLAITHAIIKKNHGSISVRPGERLGTVFTILLPAVIDDLLASQH